MVNYCIISKGTRDNLLYLDIDHIIKWNITKYHRHAKDKFLGIRIYYQKRGAWYLTCTLHKLHNFTSVFYWLDFLWCVMCQSSRFYHTRRNCQTNHHVPWDSLELHDDKISNTSWVKTGSTKPNTTYLNCMKKLFMMCLLVGRPKQEMEIYT